MSKKILFLATGIMAASLTYAQKDKFKEAQKELKTALEKNKEKPAEAADAFRKAKDAIDAASANEATKGNAQVWMTRAGVYIGMQDNEQLRETMPYREGIESLKKAFELDKKLVNEPDAINLTANGGFFAYNDGISTYNNNKYKEAYDIFQKGLDILGPDKDKRFVLVPVMDTVRAQSKMFQGYTAFYDKHYDVAINDLLAIKGSPYLEKEANIYLVLAQAYEQKGEKDKQLATLQEGKKKFPGDKNLENSELNYYLTSGKQGEMVGKLEESAAKDPTNPELQLNLGIVYAEMARPTNGAAPAANAADYRAKAEAAYKKAVELAPDNGSYNYQMGAFYFNQAADINTEMNNLGTSKEDQKKYNTLLAQRDALFKQSLPNLEKSKDIFSAKKAKLKSDEQRFYHNALGALKEIYNRNDQADKVAEIRKLQSEAGF
ncbi:tetratricopeptide repeat protein [Taibaiella koreensis]|uniref:tetratricopeptide repeat protein n=1 Tax=Taibaiella koreensis TaxID=1268548 RepID=UPI000E59F128|nr:hypothetical protein [Taibaiella koreensis]